MAGQRFGRWLVIKRANSMNGNIRWLCRCACGTEKTVDGAALRREDSTSCGCRWGENLRTHGMCTTKTYRIWASMKQRCADLNCKSYKNYGGRGICVCERWIESFPNFLSDMGESPKGCWLDRIDNNSHYSPTNCRWATPRQQANNTRRNVFVAVAGETLTVSQWARRNGLRPHTVHARIRRGWPPEMAVSDPLKRLYG